MYKYTHTMIVFQVTFSYQHIFSYFFFIIKSEDNLNNLLGLWGCGIEYNLKSDSVNFRYKLRISTRRLRLSCMWSAQKSIQKRNCESRGFLGQSRFWIRNQQPYRGLKKPSYIWIVSSILFIFHFRISNGLIVCWNMFCLYCFWVSSG